MKISTCHASLLAILLAPTLALIYSLSIYIMYVVSLDLEWYAKPAVVPLVIRMAVWMAALATWIAICQEDEKDTRSTTTTTTADLTKYLPVGGVFLVVSVWLVVQNRKWDVVGGPPPDVPPHAMNDKVVLVTGANTGIGKEIALQLYELGATVIMACRNRDKAQQARQEILRQCQPKVTSSNTSSSSNNDNHNDHDRLRIVVMDLTNLASVREAVKEMDEWKLPLHVLINNAGIMMATRETSVDGYELVMQANHLGHFLLTQLLLPKLLLQSSETLSSETPKATNDKDDATSTTTSPARVINLTSSTYKLCKRIDLDDLFCKRRPYTLFGQYSQSKLANILFTQELARRYSHDVTTPGATTASSSSSSLYGATSHQSTVSHPQPPPPQLLTWAVHPGVVKTDVTRNMHWYFRLGNYVLSSYIAALSKLPAQGAWGAVLCAASRDPPPNATYLRNGRVQATTPAAKYNEDAKRLWELSERLVGLARDGDNQTSNGATTK